MATLFEDIAMEWRVCQTNGRNVEIMEDFYSQVLPTDPDEKIDWKNFRLKMVVIV